MENNNKINRTFHLSLTTLSPVAINSGKELSPLSDYFVLDGFMYFVDEVKFQQLLLNDKNLLKKYEIEVQKTNINGANNFLINLITDKETLKSISKDHKVPFKGKQTILLKEIIKSGTQPYIPGSSIKGAIKNAVLYYWLTTEKGESELNKYFTINRKRNYESLIADINNSQLELGKITTKEKQLKKTQQKLSKVEFENRKRLKEDIKNIQNSVIKAIEMESQNWEREAFGLKDDILKQPASNLKISDTNNHSFCKSVEIANLNRKSLNDNDWALNLQEYLKSNNTFNFQISISNNFQDWKIFRNENFFAEILQQLCKSNLKKLFEILTVFSNDIIDVQDSFKLIAPGKNYRKSNEALLFLGSGKGIYKTTILMAIKKIYDKNAWDFNKEFAPLFYDIKAKYQEFPNSISHINNHAIGWLKITDPNEEAYIEKSKFNYTEDELKSGDPIEGILISKGKPHSVVAICVDNEIKEFNVQGTKKFLSNPINELLPNSKCVVYWRNNFLNFNA